METKAFKSIWYRSRGSRVTVILISVALLIFAIAGCARSARGIRVIPMSNRSVLALNPDEVVDIMRRSGFSDNQILEYGTDLRNGLAESGAVQIKIGNKVEAVFAVNLSEGNCVYISTRLRGNFIYDVDSGWVGKSR
jgi:acyl-CoA synthetase (AMP-forming)/AMP-acid ligase II